MDIVARRADELNYGSDISGAGAFRDIVHSALDHCRENVVPASAGDVEGVHQLRVAIRRLRSALLLFRPLLPQEPASRLRERLRDLGRLVGTARDWDVFVTEALTAAASEMPEERVQQQLEGATDPVRSRAHEAVADALRQPEIGDVLSELSRLPDEVPCDGGPSGKKSLHDPAAELAPKLLDKLHRKVARRGRGLDGLTRPELHELRKAIKNLRYGVEFLAPVLGRKKVKRFLKPARELQELLGHVNDGEWTAHLAEELVRNTSNSGLSEATAAISGWARRRGEAARRRLARPWRKLHAAGRCW
ncbi:MAG: CHAD domain-containing protein [Acetobacteraceae bacterium]|nr:CHAD domain-containing protein [Acetobacteraceae bacterium]